VSLSPWLRPPPSTSTTVASQRYPLVRVTTLTPRSYPVRWETTARRCAMQWCPREALVFHVCCRECAPVEVSGG
jgi:hypothetical protein